MKYTLPLTFLLVLGTNISIAETTETVEANPTENVTFRQEAGKDEKADAAKPDSASVARAEQHRPTDGSAENKDKQELIDKKNSMAEKLTQQAKDKALSQATKSYNNKSAKRVEEEDPATEALRKEQSFLILENIVLEERLKKENQTLRDKLQRLKWQRDLLSSEIEIEDLKIAAEEQKVDNEHRKKLLALTREVELAEEKARKLTSQLETQRLEWDLKTAKLESEISAFHVEKERDKYSNTKPIYLDDPVVNGNTLVISDRRIEMNGLITTETADHISTRINYYNNKDRSKPIFLVIDASPGGSAMAGYRILKAMEASKAPVYVVVKSLAASMAAIITTLAENSYAYPNAVFVHHQLSITLFLARLNVTQQKEMYEDSKKWWERMMTPVAKKMGITTDEFIKKMYESATSGDWSEFGTEAQKLKWVNNLVESIEETSLTIDPDAKRDEPGFGEKEEITAEGRAVVYLPHLLPKDAYFVYNPSNYYQLR